MPVTLREKVAGLIVLRLGSNMVPPRTAEEDADAVARLLDQHPFGGLILFNGHWPETRGTLRGLQERSENGLLVMTDMERGIGQQVGGTTMFPHLRALAESSNAEANVREFARIGAEEALACGVHVAFAPVADVSRNPKNPIISTRAFGEETQPVERLVRAYIEAAREAGLLTTAKHFPGHGNTHEDSHAVTPVVSDSFDELSHHDLPPFRAAVEAGVDLVMTAHVSYPALDTSGGPATRSHPILHDLLRDWLGFDGVVITDSLHMGGIQDAHRSEAEVAVETLKAGVDLLLDLRDPLAVVEGVAQAVEEGRLDEAVMDASLVRVERLRRRLRSRFGQNVFRDPSTAYPIDSVGSDEFGAAAEKMAREAVCVIEGEIPNLGDGDGLLVVHVEQSPTDERVVAKFWGTVHRHFPKVAQLRLNEDDSLEELRSRAIQRAERLLVAIVVKPAAWHNFGLSEERQAYLQQLINQKPTVLAALGDPRGLDGLDGTVAKICTYSDVSASRKALIEFLTTSN